MHNLERNLAPQKVQPAARKFFALPGLDRLDNARIALEKNAGVIRARLKRQSPAIFAELGVILDEVLLGSVQERREFCHIIVGEADLAGPAATRRASLTLKLKLHTDMDLPRVSPDSETKSIRSLPEMMETGRMPILRLYIRLADWARMN